MRPVILINNSERKIDPIFPCKKDNVMGDSIFFYVEIGTKGVMPCLK